MADFWFPAGKVDVLDVLEVLDIENVRREGTHEARFSCPYPGHENGDASASAYMNLDTAKWFCHGCHKKGEVVGFTASIMGISPIKAKRMLRQAYDPSSLNPDDRNIIEELHDFFARKQQQTKQIMLNDAIDESELETFAIDWPEAWVEWKATKHSFPSCDYMFERGFEPETLEDWEFGYDAIKDRVSFAIRDHDGKLVGFKARAYSDERRPKYVVLGDAPEKASYGFPRYYTGSVVFGLYAAIQNNRHIVVCEGEFNVVALWQLGIKNAVALNGSSLSDRQAQLLRSNTEAVTFFFDFDNAGHEGMWGRDDNHGEHHPGALEKLARDLDVYLVGGHDDDAAGYLKSGRVDEPQKLIDAARPYVLERLVRS